MPGTNTTEEGQALGDLPQRENKGKGSDQSIGKDSRYSSSLNLNEGVELDKDSQAELADFKLELANENFDVEHEIGSIEGDLKKRKNQLTQELATDQDVIDDEVLQSIVGPEKFSRTDNAFEFEEYLDDYEIDGEGYNLQRVDGIEKIEESRNQIIEDQRKIIDGELLNYIEDQVKFREASEKRIDELQTEKEKLEIKQSALIAVSFEEKTKLEKNLEKANEKNSVLERKLEAANKENEEKLNKLKEEFELVIQEGSKELLLENNDLKKRLSAANTKNFSLEGSLTKEKEKNQSQINQLNDSQQNTIKRNQQLEEELAKLNQENKKLKTKNESLEESFELQYDELEKELAKLNQENKKLSDDFTQQERQLKAQIEQLKQANQKLEEERLKSINEYKEGNIVSEQKINELNQTIQKLEEEKSQLTNQNNNLNEKNNTLKSKNQELQEIVRELEQVKAQITQLDKTGQLNEIIQNNTEAQEITDETDSQSNLSLSSESESGSSLTIDSDNDGKSVKSDLNDDKNKKEKPLKKNAFAAAKKWFSNLSPLSKFMFVAAPLVLGAAIALSLLGFVWAFALVSLGLPATPLMATLAGWAPLILSGAGFLIGKKIANKIQEKKLGNSEVVLKSTDLESQKEISSNESETHLFEVSKEKTQFQKKSNKAFNKEYGERSPKGSYTSLNPFDQSQMVAAKIFNASSNKTSPKLTYLNRSLSNASNQSQSSNRRNSRNVSQRNSA